MTLLKFASSDKANAPGLILIWLEALLLFPVALLLGAEAAGSFPVLLWFSAYAAAGSLGWLAACLPRRWQWAAVVVEVAAVLWMTVRSFDGMPAVIAAGLAAYLLLRGWRRAAAMNGDTLHLSSIGVGVLAYFAGSMLISNGDRYDGYSVWLTAGGVLSLALTLWTTNWVHLKQESQTGRKEAKLSKAVVRHNRGVTLLLILLILGIASIRAIADAFRALVDGLIAWIRSLIALMPEPEDVPAEPPAPAGMPELPPVETNDSWWNDVIELIMTIAGIVVGLALAAFVLFQLSKVAARLIRALAAYLRRGRGSSRELVGYVDEEESLLESNALQSLQHKMKEWLGRGKRREPRWEELRSNPERARYLYRRWLQLRASKGEAKPASATPRELLAEDGLGGFAELYEQARYGEKPLLGADDRLLAAKSEIESRGGRTR